MNVRDWLHVEDHCRGIEACLVNGKAGEAYNIGGGAELPNMSVIDTICAEVDRAFAEIDGLAQRYPDAPAAKGQPTSSLKTFVTDRAGHDRRYAINEAKARAELNYAPQHSFEDGLRQTLRWYLGNECWWRPLLKA
jgi:dTDP-glucose 4,6-dehydratase